MHIGDDISNNVAVKSVSVLRDCDVPISQIEWLYTITERIEAVLRRLYDM